jgi:surface protein
MKNLKKFLFSPIFTILVFSCDTSTQKINLHPNGVTVICENCEVGFKGILNGIEYEVVDNDLLRQRRDEGVDMSKLCTSLVTDMSELFRGAIENPNSFNQPIGNWDVSNVTDMSLMFQNSKFNQPISDWDVGKVTDMSNMFSNSPFNQHIGNWNVSNVTNMFGMFISSRFDLPLNNWNVKNVKLMGGMFIHSQFNQPIGDWDVSNVKEMTLMFKESKFSQDISKWCVTKIPSEPEDFSSNSPLTSQNKPKWGTCPK